MRNRHEWLPFMLPQVVDGEKFGGGRLECEKILNYTVTPECCLHNSKKNVLVGATPHPRFVECLG